MDLFTIEINYSKAKTQADNLEDAARQLKNMATGRLEDSCGSISRNWQGENADKYLKKVRKVQGDMEQVSKDLENTARSIRNIAKITYQADRTAYEIAQRRKVQ